MSCRRCSFVNSVDIVDTNILKQNNFPLFSQNCEKSGKRGYPGRSGRSPKTKGPKGQRKRSHGRGTERASTPLAARPQVTNLPPFVSHRKPSPSAPVRIGAARRGSRRSIRFWRATRTPRRGCAPEPQAECPIAAARRAYGKGYLKLSLVTCPVALYPASSQAEKTHFHQINRRTGHRLRQQMTDEETGEVVEVNDKNRSYEVAKGKYIAIEPEEVKAIRIESTHNRRAARRHQPRGVL